MVQGRRIREKTYKSVYKDYTIRGTAKKIACDYFGLANEVEGAECEVLLQHSHHWFQVADGKVTHDHRA